MKKALFVLLATCTLAAHAQVPQQPTPEQMRQAMMQQQQMQQMRQMQLMSVMFDLRKSKLGFDETIAAIRNAATKRGWQQGDVRDIQSAMREAGAKDAKRMKVLTLCPAGANDKVAKAGGDKTPPLPCRATVFDGKDGTVYVVRMNVSNVAKTLQGDLAKAMTEVGAEEDALYKDILE